VITESGQYTSRAFAEHCRALGVTQSMGSVGTSLLTG
jgi:transposase InsO family protein